jgi:hypothetical protein
MTMLSHRLKEICALCIIVCIYFSPLLQRHSYFCQRKTTAEPVKNMFSTICRNYQLFSRRAT